MNETEKQLHVIKGRDRQGRKSAISTCTFSRDGKMIAAGLVDGSIQLWKSNGPFVSGEEGWEGEVGFVLSPFHSYKAASTVIQWNLRIKDTLGQGVLSFIERFPLFGG